MRSNYTHRFTMSVVLVAVSLLGMSGHAFQQFATVLPGWYQRSIYELLGITVPRLHARRFYNVILSHQALLSEHEKRDVSIEEAAKD